MTAIDAAGPIPRSKIVAPNPLTFPTSTKFLIFAVLAFGQFMALIDIQIVAASLNEVQAGLSAGPDEISWIQTGYLIAELVMIPFAAFLAQALSTRWLFALSAGLFTISSALCGLAWDIESMIVFRVLQGFTGGAMVPTVFATGYSLFEGKQRALIPAILGMVSVLAPTLGPTVGGWITDVAGWRWIFYINIVPGALVTILVLRFVHVDLPNFGMLRKIDYSHLVAMAIFLGGLEYVLEEGPRNGWFDDTSIAIAAWLSLVAFVLFLERSFRSGGPIVKLTPFRKPTFAFACVFNLVIGFGIYASTYLIPVFLGRVRDYSSLQIGTTVVVTGCAQLFSVIIAARASQTVDQRIIIGIGLSLFAASLFLTSHLTPEWGFANFLWPQVLRGFSIMLCIVPSVGFALGGFQGAELRYASGIFNLMRNLGGAVGIAIVNTWLQDATRFHMLRLSEGMGQPHSRAAEFVATFSTELGRMTSDAGLAVGIAQTELGGFVARQAVTLAFNDVFRIMAWIFLAALIMAPLCKPNVQRTAPIDAH